MMIRRGRAAVKRFPCAGPASRHEHGRVCLSDVTTTWVRAAIGVGAWVATAIGAIGSALHVSPSSARVLVLAVSGAPYLMVCALAGLLAFPALGDRAGVAVAGLVVVGAAATQAPL